MRSDRDADVVWQREIREAHRASTFGPAPFDSDPPPSSPDEPRDEEWTLGAVLHGLGYYALTASIALWLIGVGGGIVFLAGAWVPPSWWALTVLPGFIAGTLALLKVHVEWTIDP